MIKTFEELATKIEAQGHKDLRSGAEMFNAFVDSGLHLRSLCRVLRAITDDIDEAGFTTNGKFIPLDYSHRISLALVRYVRPTEHILWGDEDYLQIQLTDGECEVVCYRLPQPFSEDTFNSKLQLAESSRGVIVQGGMVIKSPRQAVDVKPLCSKPVHFLRLTRQTEGNFEWAFDRTDNTAHSVITKRQAESNLLAIIDLLSQVGNAKSIDVLQRLTRHDLHFVRWRALQAIVRLEPQKAASFVAPFIADPHPEVREAAAQANLILQKVVVEDAA